MTLEIDNNQARCENCRFHKEGDCRRYPPQVGVDSACEHTGNVFYTFPRVLKNEWCGEYQPEEGWVLPKGWQVKSMPEGPGGLCEVQDNS